MFHTPTGRAGLRCAAGLALCLASQGLLAQTSPRLDTTPPTLVAFEVPTEVRAGSRATATVTLSDDLSGVTNFVAYAYNEQGQFISLVMEALNAPRRSYKTTVAIYSEFRAAGDYRLTSGYAKDYAGNRRDFSAADFAALGNAVIHVVNDGRVDTQAPQLSQGRILTPQVSLKDVIPGTTNPAGVKLALQLTDSGETATSGPANVVLNFCQADNSHCMIFGESHLDFLGHDSWPRGSRSMGLTLAGRPIYVGTYWLREVTLTDRAANTRKDTSVQFGGTTDFSSVFPGASFVVTE